MAPRTVFFRPRPRIDYFGTEWIPRSPSWQPFHPDYEEVPMDASDERPFDCSEASELHLHELYQVIRPLLTIPSFESASMCTLYANYLTQQKKQAKITDFQHRTKECLVARFRALSQKTAKLVYDGHELNQEALVVELIRARIFSMQSELIELKVWACICAEVMNYTLLISQIPDDLNHQRFWASTTAYRLGSAAAESDFSSNSAVYPISGLRRRSQQSSSQEL
ncbi:hypothetical protein GGX14DRAFT_398275 [Mycena pura]|uniref:Uncharacterized protein n=1 Tax=Mycena pura TaxID=153505 RepID=A0AAD6YDR7_9AGAR|nr:hypothetical protein GGX14DRAFT_398275 [Mycena pura]